MEAMNDESFVHNYIETWIFYYQSLCYIVSFFPAAIPINNIHRKGSRKIKNVYCGEHIIN